GLTGGDRLDFALALGAGVQAVATTQTAERAYASSGGHAELSVTLTLGPGAVLDWLPQETILFDRSRLSRRLTVDLAADSCLLLAECVVLGRAAMGETLHDIDLIDWREVRRAGKPVFLEPLRLTPQTLTAGSGALGAYRAFATIALIAPGAEDMLESLRRALPAGMMAAASAWDGKCVVRLMAADAMPLKAAMAQLLSVIRGKPLPRVWQI
ncbi:MAG: urease accessory protein UreD, partial [Paracoccaceae bacterium]|nr:urease accessory protein UreD [Paracoccaceae bacterium]